HVTQAESSGQHPSGPQSPAANLLLGKNGEAARGAPVRAVAKRRTLRSKVAPRVAERYILSQRLAGREIGSSRVTPQRPSGLHRCALIREELRDHIKVSAYSSRTDGRRR